jgi:sugar lactone lactonase YvrE
MLRTRLMSCSLAAVAVFSVAALPLPASADSDKSAKSDSSRSQKRFPARIELPVGWRPEGITAGRGNDLFVGSLADGAVWKTNARTGEGSILTPGATGRVSVGVDFDSRSGYLWIAGGGTGEVRVVDSESGAILQTYVVPGAAGVGFLNDVAVTRDAVFVTDSRRSLLVVIPLSGRKSLPDPSALTTLTLPAGVFGNGIVESRGWLIIVQSSQPGGLPGRLFRVDPATGDAIQIDLGGYPVTNGDGLELDGRNLYVVRNRSNLVAKLDLSKDLLSGSLVREITGELDVATTVALQAGRLWAVNARFGIASPATAQYWIAQLDRNQDNDRDDEGDAD